jgi:hypothetical protein
MTKKEIPDFQLPPRFEQVGNEHRKQMEMASTAGFTPRSTRNLAPASRRPLVPLTPLAKQPPQSSIR